MVDLDKYKTMSRQLRGVAENHANELTGFGQIRVADMAADCARAIDELIELYELAITTPPNLRMTREQVEAMPRLAAVWVVFNNNGCVVELRDTALREMELYPNRLYFSAPPKDADVMAARREADAHE